MVRNTSLEQPSREKEREYKVEGPLINNKDGAPNTIVDAEELDGNLLEEATQLKQARFIRQYVTLLQFFTALTQLGIFLKFWNRQNQKEESIGMQEDYLYDKERFFRGQDLCGYRETDNKTEPLYLDAVQQSGNREEEEEEGSKQTSHYIQPNSLAEPVSKKYAVPHLEALRQRSGDSKEEENKNVELLMSLYERLLKENEYEKELRKKEEERNEKESKNFTGSIQARDTEDLLVPLMEDSAFPSQNTIEGLKEKNCLYPYPTNRRLYLSGSLKEFLDDHFPSSQLVCSEAVHDIASSRHYDQLYEQVETSNAEFGSERSKGSVKSFEHDGESAQSSWIDREEAIGGGAPALKQKDDIEQFEANDIAKLFSKYDKRKNSADLSQAGPGRPRRRGRRDGLDSALKRDVKGLCFSLKPEGIAARLDRAGGDEQAGVPPRAENPNAAEAEQPGERTTAADRAAAIQSLSVKDAQTGCPEDSAMTGEESIAGDGRLLQQDPGEASRGSGTGDTTAYRSLASETATDSTQQKEILSLPALRPDFQSGAAASDVTDVSGRSDYDDDATDDGCGGVCVADHDTDSETLECSPELSPMSQECSPASSSISQERSPASSYISQEYSPSSSPLSQTPGQEEASRQFFHAPVQVSSPGNSPHVSGTLLDWEQGQWTESPAWEGERSRCPPPPAPVQSEQGRPVLVSDCPDQASEARATLRPGQAHCSRCTEEGCGEQTESCHATVLHSSASNPPHDPHCCTQAERRCQSSFHPHPTTPAESGGSHPHPSSSSSPSSQPAAAAAAAPPCLSPVRVYAASSRPPGVPETARIDLTRVHDRNFVNLDKRRATYPADWPNLSGIDAANMALSGFFFIGQGRKVRCFYCGLELDYLTSDHNIWDEHVRHSPDCPYLNAVMGSDFVAATREKLQDKEN